MGFYTAKTAHDKLAGNYLAFILMVFWVSRDIFGA